MASVEFQRTSLLSSAIQCRKAGEFFLHWTWETNFPKVGIFLLPIRRQTFACPSKCLLGVCEATERSAHMKTQQVWKYFSFFLSTPAERERKERTVGGGRVITHICYNNRTYDLWSICYVPEASPWWLAKWIFCLGLFCLFYFF